MLQRIALELHVRRLLVGQGSDQRAFPLPQYGISADFPPVAKREKVERLPQAKARMGRIVSRGGRRHADNIYTTRES